MSCRELMRRRNTGHIGQALFKFIRPHTVFIERDKSIFHPVALENHRQFFIPRIFYSINKVLVKQLNEQLKKKFCAGADDYSLRRTIYASGMVEIAGDAGPKLWISFGISCFQ